MQPNDAKGVGAMTEVCGSLPPLLARSHCLAAASKRRSTFRCSSFAAASRSSDSFVAITARYHTSKAPPLVVRAHIFALLSKRFIAAVIFTCEGQMSAQADVQSNGCLTHCSRAIAYRL